MPDGGNSPGSIQPGGGEAGCSASNCASDNTAGFGGALAALFHSIASAVASSKMASLTVCDLLAAASRSAVMASLLTLRGMPLVA